MSSTVIVWQQLSSYGNEKIGPQRPRRGLEAGPLAVQYLLHFFSRILLASRGVPFDNPVFLSMFAPLNLPSPLAQAGRR
jgi:hypothetical protein